MPTDDGPDHDERDVDRDDDAALAACARGERAALRTLYLRHGARLLGLALRVVRDRALAEDVLQDAFLQIWRGASTFDPSQGSARGWMFAVVRHRAILEARRRGRDPLVATDDIVAIADAAQGADAQAGEPGDPRHRPPPDVLDAARRADAIDECLRRLDAPQRECIVCAYVEGLTHREIAARLAKPLGTVKSWIRQGLLSLRRCLG